MNSTTNTILINVSVEKVFESFSDPAKLVEWLVPGEMTGKIHHFEFATGKGYTMSLFYPKSESHPKGKSADKEDRYSAIYLEILPFKKILQQIKFDSQDPSLQEAMNMEALFEAQYNSTKLTINFYHIPDSIPPDANEEGTASSLQKLKHLLEQE